MHATWMKALLATLGALAALMLLALTGAGAADDAWRVGYLHSLSGYLANMGTASRDGFLLAIDVNGTFFVLLAGRRPRRSGAPSSAPRTCGRGAE